MADAVLNWPAAAAAEQVDIYSVEESVDGGLSWYSLGNVAVPTFTKVNLLPQAYKWRVKSHNVAGFSEASDPVDSPPSPTKPGPVTVTINY